MTMRRTCQLVCEFCHWSSKTFTIEGAKSSCEWGEVKVQNEQRVEQLLEFYKAMSRKERADKKKRRFHTRGGNTMDLLKKYNIANTLSPKLFESLRARSTLHDKVVQAAKDSEAKPSEEIVIENFKPADAVEQSELARLDVDFYYNKSFDLDQMTSIDQRLAQIDLQPDRVCDLEPISKSLSVKRSIRCKKCERNLCRSEYSPISIRFKILSAAYYHIPELKLRGDSYPIKLKLGEFNIVEFTLKNQTSAQVRVKLDYAPDQNQDLYELVLPKQELNLGLKDDTVDYEHVPLNIRPLNEETQVIFQRLFKVGFYAKIKPKKQSPLLSIAFTMSYDVVLAQNPRESEKIERICHPVLVHLGPAE